ncbi:MAG TPA: AAA family ATPase, partial [Thermoanaerobaculia bacterium]|nr:AAA family ATPase [Thermoanaerobaculia bacterium]
LRGRPAHDPAGRAVPLTDEQEAAVRAALGGRLTAITGGPGTGKTWIVAALLRVAARLGEPTVGEIALAAPTGKAADRLQGSLRAALAAVADPAAADAALTAAPLAASTLHRLLSYSPSGEYFRRHERNPLAERLVIVDESSMLDLTLAERLLRSLPAAGRLVLLGDARQLPSVEAGAVFRDLVAAASSSGRVAVLTKSWRMDPRDPAGSSILAIAESIAAGSSPRGTRLDLREDAGALAFSGAEMLLSPPAPIASFLERWWLHQHSRLPDWSELVTRAWSASVGAAGAVDEGEAGELARLFAHYESTRLLAPTRGWSGGVGVAALNAWFRAALLRALDLAPARRDAGDADQPLTGEPVLVTRNDYRRTLFNGDHGIVLDVAAEGAAAAPMAVFRSAGGGFRALPLAALRGHLEPAWASTVHKAQGSEYDAVAVILPSADTRLLTRELLYTAVTRARRSVTLVGTVERLDQAVARAVERWSGIAEALAPAAPALIPTGTKGRSQLALPFPD